MHILLTDILRCPRCGPEFGLVLLADRMEDRRILEGRMGCANCREMYPIRGGELDLRVPGREALPSGDGAPDEDAAVRLAALLGLAEAGGSVLLAGYGAELAENVASLVPGVEVVAVSGTAVGGEERSGVNRVAVSGTLPFAPASVRGVALAGAAAGLLEEAARVVAVPGRLVVEGAPEGAVRRIEEQGLRVLLEEGGVVVAERSGGRLR